MSVLIPGGSPGAPSFPLLLKHLAYCCRTASVLSAKRHILIVSGLVEESNHNLRNADQYVVSVPLLLLAVCQGETDQHLLF